MQFESGLGDEEAYHRLVELNVKQQVLNLAHTSIIQKAWAERSLPTLHGCVYGIDDGRIKEIIRLDAKHPIDPVYKYAFT
jgi:carbonic anhydrase